MQPQIKYLRNSSLRIQLLVLYMSQINANKYPPCSLPLSDGGSPIIDMVNPKPYVIINSSFSYILQLMYQKMLLAVLYIDFLPVLLIWVTIISYLNYNINLLICPFGSSLTTYSPSKDYSSSLKLTFLCSELPWPLPCFCLGQMPESLQCTIQLTWSSLWWFPTCHPPPLSLTRFNLTNHGLTVWFWTSYFLSMQ